MEMYGMLYPYLPIRSYHPSFVEIIVSSTTSLKFVTTVVMELIPNSEYHEIIQSGSWKLVTSQQGIRLLSDTPTEVFPQLL